MIAPQLKNFEGLVSTEVDDASEITMCLVFLKILDSAIILKTDYMCFAE